MAQRPVNENDVRSFITYTARSSSDVAPPYRFQSRKSVAYRRRDVVKAALAAVLHRCSPTRRAARSVAA
jgi:hypothetical protein